MIDPTPAERAHMNIIIDEIGAVVKSWRDRGIDDGVIMTMMLNTHMAIATSRGVPITATLAAVMKLHTDYRDALGIRIPNG